MSFKPTQWKKPAEIPEDVHARADVIRNVYTKYKRNYTHLASFSDVENALIYCAAQWEIDIEKRNNDRHSKYKLATKQDIAALRSLSEDPDIPYSAPARPRIWISFEAVEKDNSLAAERLSSQDYVTFVPYKPGDIVFCVENKEELRAEIKSDWDAFDNAVVTKRLGIQHMSMLHDVNIKNCRKFILLRKDSCHVKYVPGSYWESVPKSKDKQSPEQKSKPWEGTPIPIQFLEDFQEDMMGSGMQVKRVEGHLGEYVWILSRVRRMLKEGSKYYEECEAGIHPCTSKPLEEFERAELNVLNFKSKSFREREHTYKTWMYKQLRLIPSCGEVNAKAIMEVYPDIPSLLYKYSQTPGIDRKFNLLASIKNRSGIRISGTLSKNICLLYYYHTEDEDEAIAQEEENRVGKPRGSVPWQQLSKQQSVKPYVSDAEDGPVEEKREKKEKKEKKKKDKRRRDEDKEGGSDQDKQKKKKHKSKDKDKSKDKNKKNKKNKKREKVPEIPPKPRKNKPKFVIVDDDSDSGSGSEREKSNPLSLMEEFASEYS